MPGKPREKFFEELKILVDLGLEEVRGRMDRSEFHQAASELGALADTVREIAWMQTDERAGISSGPGRGAKGVETKKRLERWVRVVDNDAAQV